MSDADLRPRLEAVVAAIGLPSAARPPVDSAEAGDGANAQRIATTQIDELLRRVAALTSVIGAGALVSGTTSIALPRSCCWPIWP